MKRLFIVMVLLLVSLSIYGNDKITISSGLDVSGREYLLAFEEQHYLIITDGFSYGVCNFEEKHHQKMRDVLSKFFEWNEIALANNTTITKEIPITVTDVPIIWQWASESHGNLFATLTFTFIHRDGNSRLKIDSGTIKSMLNPFVTFKVDGYTFTTDQVMEFNYAFSEEGYAELLEEYNELTSDHSLFN